MKGNQKTLQKDIHPAIEAHCWQVENNLYWILDVSFNEDACQTKSDNGAENLSTLIPIIALNILKLDAGKKESIKGKRKRAGWSNQYLAQLLKKFILTPD